MWDIANNLHKNMSKYGSRSGNGNERKRNYTLLSDKIDREMKRFIIVQETEEKKSEGDIHEEKILYKRCYY